MLRANLLHRFFIPIWLTLILSLAMPTFAQDATATPAPQETPIPPSRVEIQPEARDDQIERRLQDILTTTGWYINPDVRVEDGVVFLTGQTESQDFKEWATSLANNTQDVAAVVNQISVIEPPLFDFDPVWNGLRDQGRSLLRAIPILGFSIIILIFAWYISRLAFRGSLQYLEQRNLNALLRNVISRIIGGLVLVIGLYLILQVAGWTNIALTVLGGTGLLGLVIGIAFRDITENFLASVFLSVQNPYNVGDLVEIQNVTGFVQRMTTRTTILMTLAGNHVQIPNATVYKSVIHNYTSNPNRQIDFTVGIGYDGSISKAQETIRAVLESHPAILNDPESLVLVDSLGGSSVNLHIYFWINGSELSWIKVKSSVIRLVKRAIQDAGISMPDEAREMIFPQGVPVHMVEQKTDKQVEPPSRSNPVEADTISTQAEGDLKSEAEEIETQARQSRTPESGGNLLSEDPPDPSQ